MSEKELRIVTDLFGCICDYSPTDDYMNENCWEWCEEHCGQVEEWECLKKYIELRLGETE